VIGLGVAAVACGGCVAGRPDAEAQVRATEIAFAATMANRDFTRFMTFVSAEAMFLGDESTHRGPVTIGGKVVAHFTSVWRLDPDGAWRIVFDKGEPVCPSTG
jgi:ketosteroid isomerase-like protein